MPQNRLLLLSNSTNAGEEHLEHAQGALQDFLGRVTEVLFVPFAGVRISYDEYAAKVRERFEAGLGYRLHALHEVSDPVGAVKEAEALVVGGGNTFHLVRGLYEAGLVSVVRERVEAGTPYVGWSAGANVACPTLATTNDMPIAEPPHFDTFGLVPFQINPHYTDAHLADYAGESREERLLEYTALHPDVHVVGLREGSMLRQEGEHIELLGDRPARIFRHGREPTEVEPGQDLRFLLQNKPAT